MNVEPMRTLADWEKATLFLYLTQIGVPPWAKGDKNWQPKVMAALAGWTADQAAAAFEEATRRGMSDGPITEVE